MKGQTPKYNFKSYESLITDATTLPNQAASSETSYEPLQTDHSQKNKLNYPSMKSNSKKSIKFNNLNTSTSLYNESFDKTTKDFDKIIKVIKHANSFHDKALTTRHLEKRTLETKVKTLSTFVNLNRIESSTMTALSKGHLKEQDLLSYKTNIIKQDSYYLTNKVPFIQDEVNQMKNSINSNKSETGLIHKNIMQLQREILKLNDNIKNMNKMNSDALASKDSINTTLEMLRKHNKRLREMIKNQNNKTGELVHSVNVLAKKMTKHVQGIATNRKVHDKTIY